MKELAKNSAGLSGGSATSVAAVKIAGSGAGRVGAAIITHGLKVLGLGSMGVGIATTAGIGIVVGFGIKKLLDYTLGD